MTLTRPTTKPGSPASGAQRPPDAASLPNSCGRCSARWGGHSTAHCGKCHETFTSVSAFDLHRHGGECRDPAKATRLIEHQRGGYTAWGYPASADTEWLTATRHPDTT